MKRSRTLRSFDACKSNACILFMTCVRMPNNESDYGLLYSRDFYVSTSTARSVQPFSWSKTFNFHFVSSKNYLKTQSKQSVIVRYFEFKKFIFGGRKLSEWKINCSNRQQALDTQLPKQTQRKKDGRRLWYRSTAWSTVQ